MVQNSEPLDREEVGVVATARSNSNSNSRIGTKIPTVAATSTNGDDGTMTPVLDLFVLTFNCAKNFVNVTVFAAHLRAALTQGATAPGTLPDLVVFSLQEVAPISYSFIGSYFLNPYYARFEEALNVAAVNVLTEASDSTSGDDDAGQRDDEDASPAQTPIGGSDESSRQLVHKRRRKSPYTLVRAKNVGMTAIMLFARDPATIEQIEEAECGFGAADMGNKGAVGLRVTWTPTPGKGPSTEVTFVATHLAAMEWNLKRRNANWRSIVAGLTFANPRSILPGVFPPDRSPPSLDRTGSQFNTAPTESVASDSDGEEEDQPLLSPDGSKPLHPDHPNLTPEHHATLHDISIFKPSSHLFVAGDLNYRIATSTPAPLARFPSFDPESKDHFPRFLARDQLTQERRAQRAFHGMAEAPIRFGPTYKFNVQQGAAGATNEAAVRAGRLRNGVKEVPWKFAAHRWPGWCDRVLFLEVPAWVRGTSAGASESDEDEDGKIRVKAYDAMPVMWESDHRPVFFRAEVPVIEPEVMRPLEGEVVAGDEDSGLDPRKLLPVPIDVHAWERRAAARRKEIAVGWSAFLWSTREGAMVLATVLLLGAGGWWLLRMVY